MTTEQSIAAGTRVFLTDGTEAEYVCPVADQHAVRRVIVCDKGEEVLESPQIADRVHSSPPHDKIDASYAEKEAELVRISQALSAARKEWQDWERAAKERMERITQHDGLQRLGDFLDGKITHVVAVSDFGVLSVQTFQEAFTWDGRSDKRLRLSCLFSQTGEKMKWSMNKYYDGSAISLHVSRDDAVAVAKNLMDAEFEKYRGHAHGGLSDSVMKSCAAIGLPIPTDLMEKHRIYKRTVAQDRLNNLQSEVEKTRAEMAME